jgi:hypothetical protein
MKRKSTTTRKAVLPGDPTVDYPYALPYGLRPEKGVLVPEDEEATVVKQIFDLAGQGGEPAQIAETLNGQKVEAPSEDSKWTPELIEEILRNPAYIGEWGGFGRVEQPLVEPEVFESAQSSAAS